MSESPPTNAASANQPGVRRQPVWFIAAITLLVIGFLAVVVLRDQIRAHWFAYKLKNTTRLDERTYYISALTSIGDKAAGPIRSIAADNDPNLRILAVFALKSLTDNESVFCLAKMLSDSDESVREAAATALALSAEQRAGIAYDLLIAAILPRHFPVHEQVQIVVASAMARMEPSLSCWALEQAYHESKFPKVRAQIIESLGAMAKSYAGATDQLVGPYVDRNSSPAPDRMPYKTDCDLFGTLVSGLSDQDKFAGLLSLEREIAAVTGYVAGSSGTPAVNDLPFDPSNRKVSDVARKVLFELTGREIESAPLKDTPEESTFIDEIQKLYEKHKNRSATSMPTSLPDFNSTSN